MPVAQLLGEGQQRDRVPYLGYLFFVGDHRKTGLKYRIPESQDDSWVAVRHMEALDPPSIVRQARAVMDEFGVKDLKLYQKSGITKRDDSVAMQYLIPGWCFDNKQPCLVR